jgi:hypothetical protein
VAAADIRGKSLSCLRDGRVTVVLARAPTPSGPADAVCAFVDSSRGNGLRYVVDLMAGAWSCTCRDVEGCPHIAAVQLVTGHRSAAARQAAE